MNVVGPRGLHVVLGGSGGVGSAVVDALAAAGRQVRSVARRDQAARPGVESFTADIGDARALDLALDGASVVVHAAQPAYHRWPRDLVPMTRAVIEGSRRAGAALVVADNLYAYGPAAQGYGPATAAGPMTESTPERAGGPKGRARREATELLLSAHQRAGVPVAVGRASNYYGPHGRASVVGADFFQAAVAGRPVRWLGRLDQPRTLHYLPDLAAGLLRLAEEPDAFGSIWHLPAAPPVTGAQFVALVGDALGTPVAAKPTSSAAVRFAGAFSRTIRQTVELMYQWDRPFVADDSAFRHALGDLATTPHADAVRATVEWFRSSAARRHSPASPR